MVKACMTGICSFIGKIDERTANRKEKPCAFDAGFLTFATGAGSVYVGANIDKMTLEGGCGGHNRGDEVRAALVALAAFEVTI